MKSKKVISLVLACILLLGLFPILASAETSVVTVSEIAEGDIFEPGKNIILSAQTNAANIARIDFYANGVKLPGYITEPGEYYIWQSPAGGAYQVEAKITHTADDGVTEQVAPVSIFVKPEGAVSSLYSAADLENWNRSYLESGYYPNGQWNERSVMPEAALVSDYASLGTKSLRLEARKDGWSTDTLLSANIPVRSKQDFTMGDYDTVNYVVYATGVIPNGATKPNVTPTEYIDAFLRMELENQEGQSVYTTKTLENGWNVVSLTLNSAQKGYHYTGVNLNTYNGQNWTTDFRNSVALYVGGVYLSNSSDTTAFAATPVLPSGSTDVCSGMKKYRLQFNRPLAGYVTDDVVAGAVSVSDGTSNITTGITAKKGVDFIDLNIAASTLGTDKTYTVTLAADKFADCYGNLNAAGTFTFDTVCDTCTEAKPFARLTYPKSNSTLTTDSNLSASVIFSGSVTNVAFYEEAGATDTLIAGAVSEGFATDLGTEYVLDPTVDLTAGNHTIYAQVTTGAGNFVSEPVTFTASEKPQFKLVGIENGDTIMLNEAYGKTVNVVNTTSADVLTIYRKTTTTNGNPSAIANTPITRPDAAATNVDYVEYYINGTLVATDDTAPYVQDLPIEKIGNNQTLVAKIYDTLGTVTVKTVSFNGVYGKASKIWSEDFEGTFSKIGETAYDAIPIPTSITKNTTGLTSAEQTVMTHPVNKTKGLKLVPGAGSTVGFATGLMPATWSGSAWTNGVDWTTNTNRIFLEFDYSVDPWLGGGFNLKLTEGFKESTSEQSTDYAVIVLPTSLLSKNPATGIMNRVGVDFTWDADRNLNYVLYINGQECYRDTTKLAWRETINPARLMVELSRTVSSASWSCYLDNIRVAAYDTTAEASITGDRQYQAPVQEVKDKYTVTTVTGNTTAEDKDMTVYYAIYNADKSLKSVTKDTYTLKAGSVVRKEKVIDLAIGETVRAFTWKDGLQPISYLGEE